MATNSKYIVLKISDTQAALDKEKDTPWLAWIINKVAEYRRTKIKGRNPENQYLVLNMTDKHAIVALEAYIASVEQDPMYGTSPYLQEIAATFRKMKVDALMTGKERTPDA